MEIPKSTLLLLLLTIVVGISTTGSSCSTPSKDLTPSNGTNAPPITIHWYIWRSCKATLYQRVCYASVVSYATYIGEDPIHLAIAAARVTQSRLHHVSTYVDAIHKLITRTSTASGVDPRTASALADCVDMFREARDLTRQSGEEIKALVDAKGMNVTWHIGNAQTWLSAALSNQETCKDGFSTVGVDADLSVLGKLIKAFVVSRVNTTERYTSNALALVNSLVNRQTKYTNHH